jgi:hypothetical protein
MDNPIRKFHWFWGWEDNKEEAWLGKMSQNGLHLVSIGFPSLYTFTQGGPKNYVYRLDYIFPAKKEKNSYLQPFTDGGWEYLGEMANWQYFRKEAKSGEEPEIFADNASKIQKYRRLVFFLLIVSPLLYLSSFQLLNKDMSGIWGFIKMVDLLILTLFVFAMLKILARIKQLGKLK